MNYDLGYYEETIKKGKGFEKGFYLWKKTISPEKQKEIEKTSDNEKIISKGIALFPSSSVPFVQSTEVVENGELKIIKKKELTKNLISIYIPGIDGFVTVPREILEKIPIEKLKNEIENLLTEKE